MEYAYDELYRLIGETIFDPGRDPEANPPRSTTRTTRWATASTRDDSAEGLTTYTYDDNDRLLTETLAGDDHHLRATTTTATHSRKINRTDQVFYEWDFENRLVAADTDGDGTTSRRTSTTPTASASAQTVRRRRDPLPDRHQPALRPGARRVHARRHHQSLLRPRPRPDLAEPPRRRQVVLPRRWAGQHRALTERSGIVTERYIYDAFGRTIGQVGSTGNVYLFAGEQRDSATGLDYLRARYMSPSVGRFVSRDSFEGFSRNPVTFISTCTETNPSKCN